MLSERDALLKETLMPVYVVPEDEQMLYMYEEVKQAAAMHASSIFIRGETNPGETRKTAQHMCVTRVLHLRFLPVLRSMVTATAFQILVSNNAPIKAITDNAVVTLEVRHRRGVTNHALWPVFIPRPADVYIRECCLELEKMLPPSSSLLTMIHSGWCR